jgi:hypothetical protein
VAVASGSTSHTAGAHRLVLSAIVVPQLGVPIIIRFATDWAPLARHTLASIPPLLCPTMLI